MGRAEETQRCRVHQIQCKEFVTKAVFAAVHIMSCRKEFIHRMTDVRPLSVYSTCTSMTTRMG